MEGDNNTSCQMESQRVRARQIDFDGAREVVKLDWGETVHLYFNELKGER